MYEEFDCESVGDFAVKGMLTKILGKMKFGGRNEGRKASMGLRDAQGISITDAREWLLGRKSTDEILW